MELKGSKTEKNLMAAFAGNLRHVLSINIMLHKLRKMVM